MKKIISAWLLLLLATAPLTAQKNVYYRKVPKLIPQADGSYRVNTDEFYFVPVEENTGPQPQAATHPPTTETLVVQKRPALPGSMPYIGVGVSMMHGMDNDKELKDTVPAAKLAFGWRASALFRAELFYQYRGEMSDSGTENMGGYKFPYSAKVRMQDVGLNAFVYTNPADKTRFFLGAGVAATRVQPTVKIAGHNVNDIGGQLFESKWCPTYSGFVGVEFNASPKVDVDITAFYSHTHIHKDNIRYIKAYGLAFNIHFNLPEKEIVYVK